ncbi:MAG: hypothetical protein EBX50_18125, partial [Chitinophagia bacterium]|nr:hypothetical protein [Chitinophagia bacterium]
MNVKATGGNGKVKTGAINTTNGKVVVQGDSVTGSADVASITTQGGDVTVFGGAGEIEEGVFGVRT